MKRVPLILALLLCALPATAKNLSSITLLPPTTGYATPTSSGSVQLTPLCGYDDNSTDNCAGISLTWASDTPANVTVNSSGLATGTGTPTQWAGAEIIAYATSAWSGAQNGYVYGHHGVWVHDAPGSIALTAGSFSTWTISGVGTTVIISANSSGGSGDPNHGAADQCAWTSGNTAVFTVNNIGEVTATGAGMANITCTIGSLTASHSITVTNPTATLATWYVRVNGSDTNCDGTTNVDYPGSGSGLHCAWATLAHGTSTMAGTDTLVVQGGASYGTVSDNISPPSGTPAHPTLVEGDCALTSNCTVGALTGNRPKITLGAWSLEGTQNLKIAGLDLSTGLDCNPGINDPLGFACPGGVHARGIFVAAQTTANIQLDHDWLHGAQAAWNGAPGPGVTATYVTATSNYIGNWTFDDPFGATGIRADGFSCTNCEADFGGFTDVQPRTLTAVARDGSGHLTATFAAEQVVDYVVGTNLVLSGMTPSDLNGTYPVSAITFNQQTVNITGGSVVVNPNSGSGNIMLATFNTSSTPAFGQGAFVEITGATPSFLNGHYEVYGSTTNQFTVNVSPLSNPTWGTATISSGGTAATANALTSTAVGSAESASVVGTAGFVNMAHRGFDQGTGGAGNGDAWGAGFYTLGRWSSEQSGCQFNLQDCWDSLHGALVSDNVDREYANGNEGNPVKIGITDEATITNSIFGSTCAAVLAFNPNFPPEYNQYVGLPCRAGDGFLLGSRPWSAMTVANNTWEGTQNVMWDDQCDGNCASPLPMAVFITQSNLFNCFQDVNNSDQSGMPAVYFSEGNTPPWVWNNNMANGCKAPPSGGSGNHWTTNPLLVAAVPNIASFAAEVNAINWSVQLTASSPAIGAGLHNAYTPALDFSGATRPNPPAIGAYEFAGTPSPPQWGGEGVFSIQGSFITK